MRGSTAAVGVVGLSSVDASATRGGGGVAA